MDEPVLFYTNVIIKWVVITGGWFVVRLRVVRGSGWLWDWMVLVSTEGMSLRKLLMGLLVLQRTGTYTWLESRTTFPPGP